MPADTFGLLKKAAEKVGFDREKFEEGQIPTDPSGITVMPFFGDIRSLFILSSFILKAYRQKEKASRYFILCSWPGFSSLFPYVSEYWALKDNTKALYGSASGFKNKNDLSAEYYRNLNTYFFEDIVYQEKDLLKYYNSGLGNYFWQEVGKRYLPHVPSSAILGNEFHREFASFGGYKVFVYPFTHVPVWELNSIKMIQVPKNFWTLLIERLLGEGFTPVVYKGLFTYDMSVDFVGKCIHVSEVSIDKVLAVMRLTGCVIDFFGGASRMAIAARCPFISFVERSYYMAVKEYEIDDLCAYDLPKRYIFSFPTIIEHGDQETWKFNLFDNLIAKLNLFLATLDREKWPPTGESFETIRHDQVRKRNQKRFGTRFLKMIKEY